MADNNHKSNLTKIIVYCVLIILLGIGGYYYYNYLQTSSAELAKSTAVTLSKNLAGKKLDTEVLKDKKFKELQPVVVEESVLGPGQATSTAAAATLSAAEIAQIPRRHSNPFKPF
jgi:hypothetical protein